MIEKNIFVYKLFLSLSISDFSLFSMLKLQPYPARPLKKVTPSKNPPFWEIGRRFNPSTRKGMQTMGAVGLGQSSGGNPVGTRWESSWKLQIILWNHLLLIKIYPWYPVMKLINIFFSKILPKFMFDINFGIQSFASLTHEEPAYLLITFYYVCYIKYTEVKSFFGTKFGCATWYTSF